jgi:hypothetical protein
MFVEFETYYTFYYHTSIHYINTKLCFFLFGFFLFLNSDYRRKATL